MLRFFSPAPRPVDERLRQAEVDACPPLPLDALGRLTADAAALFGASAAALSIIDGGAQRFVAGVGIDVAGTSRAASFCAHAILRPGRPLVVMDALLDDRFAANPLVTGAPFVRFYAGMAVAGPGGQPLGALCVVDAAPREAPAPERLSRLVALAAEATQAIAAGGRPLRRTA